jgi:hypothetical protein
MNEKKKCNNNNTTNKGKNSSRHNLIFWETQYVITKQFLFFFLYNLRAFAYVEKVSLSKAFKRNWSFICFSIFFKYTGTIFFEKFTMAYSILIKNTHFLAKIGIKKIFTTTKGAVGCR